MALIWLRIPLLTVVFCVLPWAFISAAPEIPSPSAPNGESLVPAWGSQPPALSQWPVVSPSATIVSIPELHSLLIGSAMVSPLGSTTVGVQRRPQEALFNSGVGTASSPSTSTDAHLFDAPYLMYKVGPGFTFELRDLNNDHKPDLVEPLAGGIRVRLGRGEGTFSTAQGFGNTEPGPQGGVWFAAGDLNGDGSLDAVVWNSILSGAGDGTFSTIATTYVPFEYSVRAIGDLNGDGSADLVWGSTIAPVAFVMLGNGDFTFTRLPEITLQSGVASMAIVDLNADGRPELVVGYTSYSGGGGVTVLPGLGDGTFGPPMDIPAGSPSTASVTVADLNSDGNPDLVVPQAPDGISVLLGKGDGSFLPGTSYGTGVVGGSNLTVDANADGKQDLLGSGGGTLAGSFGSC